MTLFKNKKLIISLSVILSTIIIIFGGFFIYVNDYYHIDKKTFAEFSKNYDIKIETLDNDVKIYKPNKPVAAFVFYPGAKIEFTAYEPLMKTLAEHDIMCVLVKMPFNLAIFGKNSANGIKEKYPEIKNWYIGGHSLGGAMAADYISTANNYKGLVLLAAYSATDLSEKNIKVLSIYGSNDQVLNKEKYEDYKSNLPDNFIEKELLGGNHAFFGAYGEQSGDGKATISNKQQILSTADEIINFIKTAS